MANDELTLRPVDVDADIDVVARIVRESRITGTGQSDSTRAGVLSDLTNPMSQRDQHRIAEVAGEPVGTMFVELDPESREVFVQLSAVGAARGRVFAELLREARACAARFASADPTTMPPGIDPFALSPDFWQMPCTQGQGDTEWAGILEDGGLRMIRSFWTMKWDIPVGMDEPIAPQGVSRRPVTTDEDLRIVHAIDQAAFADHFGFLHENPFDHWMELAKSQPGYAPDRWSIAELDGKPVGVCVLNDSRAEFDEEYVDELAVLREARGRGIAGWLLRVTAYESALRGIPAVTLHCDSENTTNATALYESVGFTVRNQVNLWNEPVSVDA